MVEVDDIVLEIPTGIICRVLKINHQGVKILDLDSSEVRVVKAKELKNMDKNKEQRDS